MSITTAWVAHWSDAPGRSVLVDAETGHELRGGGIEQRSRLAARRLARAGVVPGDRVLLSCAPSVDTVLLYVAVLRLGAVVVPANTAYTPAELAHIVGDVRPALAILDDRSRVEGLPLGSHRPDLATAAARLDCDPELDATTDDDLAMVAYTSGTTGRPKGARLTHRNLRSGAEALVEAWRWTPADRLVHALPMFHMHGLGAAINGSLTAGASMVVLPRFDPDAVVSAATEHRATLFFGVPTMYARLRDAGRLGDLRGLRLLVSGSAPLDPALFAVVTEQAGQSPVERYGMTETVMLASNPVDGVRRAGSVGRALPHVDIRLGAEGAVEVRGPNVFTGYWERPDATAAAFTDDGWFITGDIGELDDDGYLSLVGRAGDLIITGGYNVYPREVEDAVLEHPDVVDVAVVGRPDDTWGETVEAYVVLRAEATYDGDELADLLGEHVAGRIAAYKRPRSWRRVDGLPRNAMGKVRRDLLRGGD